jgi:hypothetical protein
VLAEFAVEATSQAFADASFNATEEHWKDKSMSYDDEKCYRDCSVKLQDISNAIADSTLADVRTFLADAKKKNMELNCDACRHGADKKKVDIFSKGNNLEKMMAVLPVLIDRVLPK